MGDWELLDNGSFNGVRKWIRGLEDGSVDVKHEDVGSRFIIEDNKRAQNEDFDRKADMWHAASIPAWVQHEWLTKHGVHPWSQEHEAARRKLLNSSEYNWCKRAPIVI